MAEIRCPFATDGRREILCNAAKTVCGNQRYCELKGKFLLTENAKSCPVRRKEERDG